MFFLCLCQKSFVPVKGFKDNVLWSLDMKSFHVGSSSLEVCSLDMFGQADQLDIALLLLVIIIIIINNY